MQVYGGRRKREYDRNSLVHQAKYINEGIKLMKTGNYDSVFKYWVEIFPLKPGHFTGPPLLVASNIQDVRKLFEKNKPKGIYFFSK